MTGCWSCHPGQTVPWAVGDPGPLRPLVVTQSQPGLPTVYGPLRLWSGHDGCRTDVEPGHVRGYGGGRSRAGSGGSHRSHRRRIGRPGGGRRTAGRADRRRQVLRRPARAAAHQPLRPQGRGGGGARSVRVGQVDALPGHQPAGDHPVRHRSPSTARNCPEEGKALAHLRADVGMVFQSFNLFAHKTILENVTLGPMKVRKKSAAEAKKRGMELLKRVGRRVPGGQVSGAAVRRSAAAGGDRPGPGHGPEGDLVRRADLGPGPGDGQRGARRDGRPGAGRA